MTNTKEFKVISRTGKHDGLPMDCIVQAVDLNFNGKYVMRYNIGVRNYQGFHSSLCIYDNDKFNEEYEIIQ